MSETNHIAPALVEAQRHARALFKEAKNDHHRYAYASAEQVIDEARRALGQAGLALFQMSDRLNRDIAKGDVIGEANCEYRLVHKSGQEMVFTATMPVIISKGRPDDKAYCAALTTCLAYFLRGLLLIPRDDAAAAIDQRDDRGYDPAEAQRQLADRFIADIAKADMAELEELREASKRELEEEFLPRVREAYRARKQQLAPQQEQRQTPAQHQPAPQATQDQSQPATKTWADAELEARNELPTASAQEADAIRFNFADAPEPHRSRVLGAVFLRFFSLAESVKDLSRYVTEIQDSGIEEQVLTHVREAYAARRAALTRAA